MSLSHMAKADESILEAVQVGFLWGGKEGERSYHLVKWEMVKQPRKRGDMG